MNEEDYNKIYSPQIISVVNIDNLEEKQNRVKNNCKSTLEDLLEIAVYEEVLNKSVSQEVRMVLENKLKITDQVELARQEEKLVKHVPKRCLKQVI